MQWREQNIGEDQIERRAGADFGGRKTRGAADTHQCSAAVKPCIVARDQYGIPIDITCQHATAQALGGGDRQHAASGAKIENPSWFCEIAQLIQSQ